MLPRACVTGALGIDGRVIGRRERASKTGSSVVVDNFFCFVPLPWSQTLVRFLASLCAQGRVWANSAKTRLCSVGREFKFWQPNKVTNGAKRRSNVRLAALRTRANGGERSEIRLGGSGITRVERTRGIGASFDSKRASELCHRAPTSFSLAPSCSRGKALAGGKGGRDEGYAAPNPARARRGAVRRDRRSRLVPVYDPIAR